MNQNTAAPCLRVLHVDDFDEFLEEFRTLFGQDLDITSAPGGAEGLALLEDRDFDAVIVDYDMPGMDGLAFMAAVKAKWPAVPVIFCTGQGSEAVARRAFMAGASDYFVKDFSVFVDREKLVNSVRRAVDLRVAEERLQEERRVLERLIDSNPYSIQIYNRAGYHRRSNPAHFELSKGHPGDDYLVFEDPILLGLGYGPLFERMKKGETVRFPIITYNSSWLGPDLPDVELHAAAVGFPLLDSRGNFDGMVIMHEDVTARVQAEACLKDALASLQESHDLLERRVEERTLELAEANRSLEEQAQKRELLQAELVRKNRELEEFSSRVSHDLRNELLVLRKTLEVASEGHSEMEERSRGLLERYDHLIEFVERLLSLARAGTTIGRRMEVPAEPLLRSLFERLHSPDVEARLSVSPGAPPIPGDPLTLEQLFSNLISNSFQYRQRDRGSLAIEVGVREVGPETEVVYRDDGLGIQPENLDRIFDMSFTTDGEAHFGLGLSLVKKIAEAHGGHIRAESAGPGQGASFILRLPLPLARRKALLEAAQSCVEPAPVLRPGYGSPG